jgi:DNA-3-methyladenine glycosylase II
VKQGESKLPTSQILLKPVSPFSFELSAKIFSNGDKQIRLYESGKFIQVISSNKKLILATLESKGTTEKPELVASLNSDKAISAEDERKAAEILRSLFNMDFDPEPFYESVKQDKTMELLISSLLGLRSPTTQTVFEALVDSIIEQQISLKVATSIERSIIKKYGETLDLGDKKYYAYPTPQSICSVSTGELRGCGLTQRKAEYIKEISNLIVNGKLDLEKFKQYESVEKIIEELDAIRGIGVWTAELTIIRSMQKWDAFPADDVGLRRIIAHYYCKDQKITSEQARQIGESWGKWKGLAAYHLVVADLLNLKT